MKVDSIISEIKSGKTLYIATALKVIVINKKVVSRFEKANHPLLKDGGANEVGFYMASGKNYVYVGPGCKVWYE